MQSGILELYKLLPLLDSMKNCNKTKQNGEQASVKGRSAISFIDLVRKRVIIQKCRSNLYPIVQIILLLVDSVKNCKHNKTKWRESEREREMKREGRSVISFIDLVRMQRSQKDCEKTSSSRTADHFYIQSSLYITLLFIDSMKIVTTKSGQNPDRMRKERSSTEVAIFFIDLVRVQRNQTDCQKTSYNSEFQIFVSNQSYKLFSYSST